MTNSFVGRNKELKKLKFYLKQRVANLLVITGRRRVGKSRLIGEFAKNKNFIKFIGIPPGKGITAQTQRDEFARKLALQFDLPPHKADDWSDLFETLAKQTQQEQVIILLDELSWMASDDPTFLGKLKTVWDEEFKQNSKLTLILCSSISSWIDKNILSSTGYVGRVAYTLHLDELPLNDSKKFWRDKQISAHEKFKVLSITGGIPLYLENIDPSQPAEENIHRLCFSKGGLLVREFKNIFSDYFSTKSAVYEKILRTLVKGPMEASKICSYLSITYTGLISEYFDDLEQAGFITRDHTWNLTTGADSKLSKYRLSDNYTRFYLKYIDPIISKINRNSYELTSLTSLENLDTIMGLQFENLVLNNRQLIKQSLNIKFGDIINDNPFYQRKTTKMQGCQVDYMIQTKFNTLYVCEIKFCKNPIGSKIINEMKEKIENIYASKNYSIRPVLIHVNGVTNDVLETRYFDEIIDFSEYLN